MEQEDSRKRAYSNAIELARIQAQALWASFQAIVTSNSLLIAIIGFLSSKEPHYWRPVAVVLPIFGMLLSAAWFFTSSRHFNYYDYFITAERGLEKDFPPEEQILTRGKLFGEGSTVDIPGTASMRMSWGGRAFANITIARGIITLFAISYIVIILLALLSYIQK